MKVIHLLLPLLLSTSTVYADSLSERVAQLEKDVQDIKAMLAIMVLATQSKDDTQQTKEFTPQGDGWKDIKNWRKLKKGMSPDQVEALLGEHISVNGGNFTRWKYGSLGEVIFYEGGVYSWEEPR